MLTGQVVGRLYTIAFSSAMDIWMTMWVLTGACLFSVAFYVPICLAVGIGWLYLEGFLYGTLRA